MLLYYAVLSIHFCCAIYLCRIHALYMSQHLMTVLCLVERLKFIFIFVNALLLQRKKQSQKNVPKTLTLLLNSFSFEKYTKRTQACSNFSMSCTKSCNRDNSKNYFPSILIYSHLLYRHSHYHTNLSVAYCYLTCRAWYCKVVIPMNV
jgi:hypothetical protein